MAIYHLSQKIGKRAQGKNAVFAVAYIRGEKRTCVRTEETKDFSAKQGELVYSNCILPDDAPDWATKVRNAQVQDANGELVMDTTGHTFSEMAWNQIELMEKRQDAQLYFHYDIAIPVELSQADAIALVEDYAKRYIAVDGFFCDVAIHWDLHNPHAHLITPMRTLTDTGYSNKIQWSRTELGKQITHKREGWATLSNQMLMARGIDARIDHRSNEARGIQLLPTVKVGKATHMTGSEHQQIRIAQNQAIRAANYAAITASPEILATKLAQEHHTFSDAVVRDELQKHVVEKAVLDAMVHSDNASHEKIVADIITHLSKNEVVFGERELKSHALELTNGNIDFEKVVRGVTTSPDILSLGLGVDGRQHYVTRAAFDLELSLIDTTKALGAQSTFAIDKTGAALIAKPFGLNPSQKNAFDHIVHGSNAAIVTGYAGTGKTFMLNAAREAWEHAGYRVRGVAFSGRAAQALGDDAKMKTMTCAGFLYAMKKGYIKLGTKDVLVMDEMGMTSLDDAEHIMRLVKQAGAKFVGVGDTEQTQPVGRGAPMRTAIGTIGAREMSTIVRHQGEDAEWMIAATLAMETKQTGKAMDAYHSRGHVQLLDTFDAALEGSAAAWSRHIDIKQVKTLRETILIAAENDTVDTQNRLARQFLVDAGYLNTEVRVMTQDATLFVAEGERLLFGYGAKPYKARNGQFGTITRITDSTLFVTLDNAKHIQLPLDKRLDMTYGYAATTHKLQGFTGDRAIPLIDSRGWDRHKTLVAASRHRFGLEVFADLETFEDYDDLREVLSRDGLSDSVIDYPTTFALRRGFDSDATGKRVVNKVRNTFAPVADAWLFLTNYSAYLEKHPTTPLDTEASITARRQRAVLVADFADTRIAVAQTMSEFAPLQAAQAECILRFAILQEVGLSPLHHQVMRDTLDEALNLQPQIDTLQSGLGAAHLANAKRAQKIAADITDFQPALDKNRITARVLEKAVAAGQAHDVVKDVLQQYHLKQYYNPTLSDTLSRDMSAYYPHMMSLITSDDTRSAFMQMLKQQAWNHRYNTAMSQFPPDTHATIGALKYYLDVDVEVSRQLDVLNKAKAEQVATVAALPGAVPAPLPSAVVPSGTPAVSAAVAAIEQQQATLHQLSCKRDQLAATVWQGEDVDTCDALLAHFDVPPERIETHANRALDRALVERFAAMGGSDYATENRIKQFLAHKIASEPKRYGIYVSDFLHDQDDWKTVNLEHWRYQKHLALLTADEPMKTHLQDAERYHHRASEAASAWQRAIAKRGGLEQALTHAVQGVDITQAHASQRLTEIESVRNASVKRALHFAQGASVTRDKAASIALGTLANNVTALGLSPVAFQKLAVRASTYRRFMKYQQSVDERDRLALAKKIMHNRKQYSHYSGWYDAGDALRRESRTYDYLSLSGEPLTPEVREAIVRIEHYDSARQQAGAAWAKVKAVQKRYGISDIRALPAGLLPLLDTAKKGSLKTNALADAYVSSCIDNGIAPRLEHYAVDTDKLMVAAGKHRAYTHVQDYLAGDGQTQVRLSAVILDDKASYQYCYEFGLEFSTLHQQAIDARALTAADDLSSLSAADITHAVTYARVSQTIGHQYQALTLERKRLTEINNAWGDALDIKTREPLKVAYPTSALSETLQNTVNQLSITRDTLAHHLTNTARLTPLIDHFRLKPDIVHSHAERYADRQKVKAFDSLRASTESTPNPIKQALAHHFKTERKRYGIHFATTLKEGWRDINLENWGYEKRIAYHQQSALYKAQRREVLRYKTTCREVAVAWKAAFARKEAKNTVNVAVAIKRAQGLSHLRNKLASQLVSKGLDTVEAPLAELNIKVTSLSEQAYAFDTIERYRTSAEPATKLRLAHGLHQNIKSQRAALAVHDVALDIEKDARLYSYLQQTGATPTAELLATVSMLESYRLCKSRAGQAWYAAKSLEKAGKDATGGFNDATTLQSVRNEAAYKVMQTIHESQSIVLADYDIDVVALEKAAAEYLSEKEVLGYIHAPEDKKGEAAYHLLKNRRAYHMVYRHQLDFKGLRAKADAWLVSDALTLAPKTKAIVVERKRWDVERIESALRADPQTFYRTILGEPKRSDGKTLDYGGGLKVELRGRYAGNWRDWAAGVGGSPIKALEVHQGLSFKAALEQGARMAGLSDDAAIKLDAQVVQKKIHDAALARDIDAAKHRSMSIVSAQSIWAGTIPIAGTLSERYFTEHRGIENVQSMEIRHWAAGTAWDNIADGALVSKTNNVNAAVMAIKDAAGEVTGVQRIYLDKHTGGKNTFMKNPKLSKGVVQGSAGLVQKGAMDQPLYIVEGPETGASIASIAPNATVLASTGVGHLKHMVDAIISYAPCEVIMAADNDGAEAASMKTTEAAFAALTKGLAPCDIPVRCVYPEALPGLKKTDWNDVHQQQGAAVVKAQLAAEKPLLATVVTPTSDTTIAFAYTDGERFCRETLGLVDVDLSPLHYDATIMDSETEQVTGGVRLPMVTGDGGVCGEAVYSFNRQEPTLQFETMKATSDDAVVLFREVNDCQSVIIADNLHDAAVLAMTDKNTTIYVCDLDTMPRWIGEQHADKTLYIACHSLDAIIVDNVWRTTAHYRAQGVAIGTITPREQAHFVSVYEHYNTTGDIRNLVRRDTLMPPVEAPKRSLLGSIKEAVSKQPKMKENEKMTQPLGNASFGAYYVDFIAEEKAALDAYFAAVHALEKSDSYDDAVRVAECAVAASVALKEKAIMLVEQPQAISATIAHSNMQAIEERVAAGHTLNLHDTRALIDDVLKPKIDTETWNEIRHLATLFKGGAEHYEQYKLQVGAFVDNKKALIEKWRADAELPMVGFGHRDQDIDKLTPEKINRSVLLGFTRAFEGTVESENESQTQTQSVDRGRGGYKL